MDERRLDKWDLDIVIFNVVISHLVEIQFVYITTYPLFHDVFSHILVMNLGHSFCHLNNVWGGAKFSNRQ